MATYNDLAEAVWTQVENRPLYPLAEILANGINPAMTLLTLLRPALLTQRIIATVPAYTLTLDLRQLAPRTHRVLRVLLGTQPGDVPERTHGQFTPLHSATRANVARITPGWLRTVDLPKKWFMLGAHLVALSPRPMVDIPITIISAVTPPRITPATADLPTHLDGVLNDEVVDIAVALLRLKEGKVETEQSLQKLVGVVSPKQARGVA